MRFVERATRGGEVAFVLRPMERGTALRPGRSVEPKRLLSVTALVEYPGRGGRVQAFRVRLPNLEP